MAQPDNRPLQLPRRPPSRRAGDARGRVAAIWLLAFLAIVLLLGPGVAVWVGWRSDRAPSTSAPALSQAPVIAPQ